MVATTMSTFTSMTAHCARCHNHKFDPIPQQDYYNLQAVFAGIDRADRPYDDDPAVHHRRQELLERKAAMSRSACSRCSTRWSSRRARRSSDLDSRIQDAGLQIAHIGPDPKTTADAELKKQLEARRIADRKRKQEMVDAIVGPETYAAIERFKPELKAIDEQIEAAAEASLRLHRHELLHTGGNIPSVLCSRVRFTC